MSQEIIIDGLLIEAAHLTTGEFIGYRLTTSVDTSLIFADQKGRPGIRMGDHFVAGWQQTIQYREVSVSLKSSGN